MRPNQTMRRGLRLSAFTATLLVLACQGVAPTGPGRDQDVRGGTGTQVGGSLPVTGDGMRAKLLGAEQPMRVSAAQGGVFVSEDGTLKATIPPGALSADSYVRFAPAPTKEMTANAMFTPGIQFAVDLGGATLKPDTAITVEAIADPRLVEEARKNIPDFKPEMLNLVEGPDGAFRMQMQVRGAFTGGGMPPEPPAGNGWSLDEFGPSLAADPDAEAPASRFALLQTTESPSPDASASAEPTPTPSPAWDPAVYATACETGDDYLDSFPPMKLADVGKWNYIKTVKFWAEDRIIKVLDANNDPIPYDTIINSYGEFFACVIVWHPGCDESEVKRVVRTVSNYNRLVKCKRQPNTPEDNLDERAQKLASKINCDSTGLATFTLQMLYTSDDPTVDGTYINGAPAKFGKAPAVWDVVTRDVGTAFVPARDDKAMPVTAWAMPAGLNWAASGGRKRSGRIVIKDGARSGHLQWKWAKNSPKLNFTLTSEVPVSTFTLTYTVDGQTRTLTPGTTNTSLRVTSLGPTRKQVWFYAPVSDDTTNHTVKVEKVEAGTEIKALALPAPVAGAQRTREYNLGEIKLLSTAPKYRTN